MTIPPNDVRVWFQTTEGLTDEALRAGYSILSPSERERADRFKFQRDRRDYVVGHDLLRRCLSSVVDLSPDAWQFDTGPHGKPILAGSTLGQLPPASRDLCFNLSHTGGVVGCAVAHGVLLGIDVERTNRQVDLHRLAARILSPAERSTLDRATDPVRCFFEFWTLKEAFVKATGIGLGQQLASISFQLSGDGRLRFTGLLDAPNVEYRLALYSPTDDSVLAVVALGKPGGLPLSFHAESIASQGRALVDPVAVSA